MHWPMTKRPPNPEAEMRRARKLKVPCKPDDTPIFFHPTFGPIDQMADIKTIYDDGCVQRLCRAYRIEDESQVASLWDFLKFAASVYVRERANQESINAAPSVTDLAKIEKLARSLSASLDALDRKTESALWLGDTLFSLRAYRPEKRQGGAWDESKMSDDKWLRERLSKSDILSSVGLIASYAQHAIESLPKSVGGRPSDYPLWMWAVNAESFWKRSLGRKFTLDSHEGGPISPAARFCRDVLQPLAPDVEYKSLAYMMREIVRRSRKPDWLPWEGRRKRK